MLASAGKVVGPEQKLNCRTELMAFWRDCEVAIARIQSNGAGANVHIPENAAEWRASFAEYELGVFLCVLHAEHEVRIYLVSIR
ncbi:hypothetical protein I6F35_35425 [Bradyrhizobium sp. BRP22]|uniref:hypothetical protein n=1 Tax=Bradyrhizobium sp. BRP22 TaxID=2793821 RepID=UPI001CD7D6E3|nr:hypothetical protein [Bradyrhizobium sp. BRP22]MCA1458409.1 hypothetical protein [Bradyrhizobium sp. BRP22]